MLKSRDISVSSSSSTANQATSLSDRMRALESAGIKDTVVRKRIPSHSASNLVYLSGHDQDSITATTTTTTTANFNGNSNKKIYQNPNLKMRDINKSDSLNTSKDETPSYLNDSFSNKDIKKYTLNDEDKIVITKNNINLNESFNSNHTNDSYDIKESYIITKNDVANQQEQRSASPSVDLSYRASPVQHQQYEQEEQQITKDKLYYENIDEPTNELSKYYDDLNRMQKNFTYSSNLNHSTQENINNNKSSLIFNSDYTHNMNQNYHTDHFNCWNCDNSLTGSRYILKDEHPYCIKCYEDLFAHSCEECQRKIGTDSKDLSYKDRHWHEKCFFCSVCKIPLVDKPFGSKNDALYCGECYNQAFASRCDKCTQIFKPGMKKMEYKGQQFHENCFTCFSCNIAIGTKSFIPKDAKIFCVPCYEDNFATKCTRCIKVISQGGVTYKNQPFHRECFTCTNCQQSLAGQRFTSREDHPYCSDCFGKLFAKKCCSCVKPITGIGGTKYISFEDRHWHNDCFTCNKCRSSLVGRGFLTEGLEVLCPECGRN